jgi:hypothetical protein
MRALCTCIRITSGFVMSSVDEQNPNHTAYLSTECVRAIARMLLEKESLNRQYLLARYAIYFAKNSNGTDPTDSEKTASGLGKGEGKGEQFDLYHDVLLNMNTFLFLLDELSNRVLAFWSLRQLQKMAAYARTGKGKAIDDQAGSLLIVDAELSSSPVATQPAAAVSGAVTSTSAPSPTSPLSPAPSSPFSDDAHLHSSNHSNFSDSNHGGAYSAQHSTIQSKITYFLHHTWILLLDLVPQRDHPFPCLKHNANKSELAAMRDRIMSSLSFAISIGLAAIFGMYVRDEKDTPFLTAVRLF